MKSKESGLGFLVVCGCRFCSTGENRGLLKSKESCLAFLAVCGFLSLVADTGALTGCSS